MQLILMRHGEAQSPVTSDAARQLTARGWAQAASTAGRIVQRVKPDLFVVSPLVRAQQTRQAFDAYCTSIPVITFDGIKPDDKAALALDWLSEQQGQCIVVICHMNIVAYLGGLLVGEPPRSFELAEARVYEQAVIANGLSVEQGRIVPLN
ncbi:MAG: phosphohistidine phosphatase [Moraxellaceae bacterium]|nr:MAG: phosphohistidine phosphatase [Moraxellaceae bacterium]